MHSLTRRGIKARHFEVDRCRVLVRHSLPFIEVLHFLPPDLSVLLVYQTLSGAMAHINENLVLQRFSRQTSFKRVKL